MNAALSVSALDWLSAERVPVTAANVVSCSSSADVLRGATSGASGVAVGFDCRGLFAGLAGRGGVGDWQESKSASAINADGNRRSRLDGVGGAGGIFTNLPLLLLGPSTFLFRRLMVYLVGLPDKIAVFDPLKRVSFGYVSSMNAKTHCFWGWTHEFV